MEEDKKDDGGDDDDDKLSDNDNKNIDVKNADNENTHNKMDNKNTDNNNMDNNNTDNNTDTNNKNMDNNNIDNNSKHVVHLDHNYSRRSSYQFRVKHSLLRKKNKQRRASPYITTKWFPTSRVRCCFSHRNRRKNVIRCDKRTQTYHLHFHYF